MARVDPGQYLAAILSEAGLDENVNGTPFFYMTFRITHRAVDGVWAEMEPFERDIIFYLSDKARSRTEDNLLTLGFNGDYLSPSFTDEKVTNIELVCEHETNNGKTYERWKIADLIGGKKERKQVARDIAMKLNAQIKTKMATSQTPPKPAPPVKPKPRPVEDEVVPPPDDKDIPF